MRAASEAASEGSTEHECKGRPCDSSNNQGCKGSDDGASPMTTLLLQALTAVGVPPAFRQERTIAAAEGHYAYAGAVAHVCPRPADARERGSCCALRQSARRDETRRDILGKPLMMRWNLRTHPTDRPLCATLACTAGAACTAANTLCKATGEHG